MSDMIEVRVADAEGAPLDWMVAKVEGQDVSITRYFATLVGGDQGTGLCVFDDQARRPFRPSANWAQGGPLIERYGVTIEHALVGKGDWHAFVRSDEEHAGFYADSPLIAAMRAIVSFEMGETVQVPAELVEAS